MPRYYSNGLEMPEPKKHKEVTPQQAQDAFALVQDRGKKNHAAQEKAPKKRVAQMWLPEDVD